MSPLWQLKQAAAAPIRFFRYLNRPGEEFQARFQAMSAAEKEQMRERSWRRNGWFLSFVDMKPPAKKRP